jgi:hypothetical protein
MALAARVGRRASWGAASAAPSRLRPSPSGETLVHGPPAKAKAVQLRTQGPRPNAYKEFLKSTRGFFSAV